MATSLISATHGDQCERDKIMEEHCVLDGSSDVNGKIPNKFLTGSWKLSLFLIMMGLCEKMSYFGIGTSLVTYLTQVMHEDLERAAKDVNTWVGVTTVCTLFGAFLADSYLGRFTMVLISSLLYILALFLLTLSQLLPSLNRCVSNGDGYCTHPRRVHQLLFFFAIYMMSIATGGHRPCLGSFGADQFDHNSPKERNQKMSFFNLWSFVASCGLLVGVTVIAYVQENVNWGIASLILLVSMVICFVFFMAGIPFYRYRLPDGSPFTPMVHVIVAAIIKRRLEYPSNPTLLHEISDRKKRKLSHTNKLRFLDRAAIVEDGKISRWRRVATVTEVEETKLVFNIVPIWLTSLTFGITMAQATTFFVKQGSVMERKVCNSKFEIPPTSVCAFAAVGMIVSVACYDRILVPYLRRLRKTDRGMAILQRIGIGMVFSVVSMVSAALVERKRLMGLEKGNVRPLMMSVWWLVPQCVIMGVGDGFGLTGLQEYFYEEVPDSMKSMGMAFYVSVIGMGSFMSSLLITVVSSLTGRGGGSWFGKDLNTSRLDKFYRVLSFLCALNLCVFIVIARRYTYKNIDSSFSADVNIDNEGL